MSRLVALGTHPLRVPLTRPFVTARRSTDHVAGVLVEAVDDEGRSGWGEAVTTWRVTGESEASVAAVVAGPLADAVVGADPADAQSWAPRLADAVVGNASARAAVESALVDLAARAAGRPLAEHLSEHLGEHLPGGTAPTVRTDMTLSAVSEPAELDGLLRRAVQLAATFGTLKVKVTNAPVTRDVLPEVRRAVGPAPRLRVDANQAWDVTTAIEILGHWQGSGVGLELVEQPVAAWDLAGLATVHRTGIVPVLADESVHTVADVEAIVGAAGGVNVKLAKAGGPLQALTLARRARDLGLGVLVGCMMEGPVGVAAAANVAAVLDATGEPAVHDLDAGLWLAPDPRLQYAGDRLVLPLAQVVA